MGGTLFPRTENLKLPDFLTIKPSVSWSLFLLASRLAGRRSKWSPATAKRRSSGGNASPPTRRWARRASAGKSPVPWPTLPGGRKSPRLASASAGRSIAKPAGPAAHTKSPAGTISRSATGSANRSPVRLWPSKTTATPPHWARRSPGRGRVKARCFTSRWAAVSAAAW